MEKPIVIYTDHIMNRTLCYNFAKGSDSLLCNVKDFKEFDKTIATYGVLRGTLEVINKVKNYYYMDHGYFNQSKRILKITSLKLKIWMVILELFTIILYTMAKAIFQMID